MAASVTIIYVTIHQQLFRQINQLPCLDLVNPLYRRHCRKGPAATTLALVLYGSYCTVLSPIDAIRECRYIKAGIFYVMFRKIRLITQIHIPSTESRGFQQALCLNSYGKSRAPLVPSNIDYCLRRGGASYYSLVLGTSKVVQALQAAWKAACTVGSVIVRILSGYEFLIRPITLQGPCMPDLVLQIDGTLLAPSEILLTHQKGEARQLRWLQKITKRITSKKMDYVFGEEHINLRKDGLDNLHGFLEELWVDPVLSMRGSHILKILKKSPECRIGNTAVYLLYAHARICSIIKKSGVGCLPIEILCLA